jgi:hypothetical protein
MTELLLGFLGFVDGGNSGNSELQGLLDKGKLTEACVKVIAMMSVLNSMEDDLEYLALRIQVRS